MINFIQTIKISYLDARHDTAEILLMLYLHDCLPFRSTCVHPRFLWESCYLIFISFMCMFCSFVLFLSAIVLSVLRCTAFDYTFCIVKRLAIVLSVLRRYPEYEYPFGIFKLFLALNTNQSINQSYLDINTGHSDRDILRDSHLIDIIIFFQNTNFCGANFLPEQIQRFKRISPVQKYRYWVSNFAGFLTGTMQVRDKFFYVCV